MLNLGNPASQPPRKPFHWLLEFPEVFLEGETKGFAAIVGNPPFMGGLKLQPVYGADYRAFLVEHIANNVKGVRGTADLCAYFFLRTQGILRSGEGLVGLIATNTIAQGDTCEVGLEQLVHQGFDIPRAVSSRKWIGQASLEVAQVWLHFGKWSGSYFLDNQEVPGISFALTIQSLVERKPYSLISNKDKSFQGVNTLGIGFVLEPEEAQTLISKNVQNGDVILPYLNGQDLNSRSDQSPSRCRAIAF